MTSVNKFFTQTSLLGYFRSGWAFLLPYLAAYLLCAWLRWPVNPAGTFSSQASSLLHPPALLHVYWFLHGLHLLLGGLALRLCWIQKQTAQGLGNKGNAAVGRLWPAVPWILLALLFWIPGAALEFPSDPSEHFARINDWSRHTQVTDHIVWFKSSYFLAYSLVGWITPTLWQIFILDLYFTACCMLLCWQYYLLGLTVGLSRKASFIFVFLQAFALGNNIFGFYRYYGLSSTIFAQLGAVAFVRLAFEWLSHAPFRLIEYRRWAQAIALLVMIGFSHFQGLALAIMGAGSVVIWRLLKWRAAVAWTLTIGAFTLSAAASLWWPREPILDEIYKPAGWLTSWYAFNIFLPSSPAFVNMTAILGVGGFASVGAAILLFRKNHVSAWLTLLPLLTLASPLFAIPFSNALAGRSVPAEQIVAFHRMLLGIPIGMTLVVGFESIINAGSLKKFLPNLGYYAETKTLYRSAGPLLLLIGIVFVAVALPANGPWFNRVWNTLAVEPADLRMRHLFATKINYYHSTGTSGASPRVMTTPGISFALNASGMSDIVFPKRLIMHQPVSLPPSITAWIIEYSALSQRENAPVALIIPQPTMLFSRSSQAATLSTHWLAQEIALEHAGNLETEDFARTHFSHGQLPSVMVTNPPAK